MLAIFGAALLVLLLDHGRLLRRAGATPQGLVESSWRQLSSRRFLEAGRTVAGAAERRVRLMP